MKNFNDLSDHELVVLLKVGNESAYAEIYQRFSVLLYRHARRMLNDHQEAEDILQEVFLILWNKAPDLDVKSNLAGYLYNSVRNRIFNYLDHSKVKEKYMASLECFLEKGEAQTDHRIRERQLREMIEQELALLPPRMRAAFELSRNSNLSYKEIAEQLNVSESVVRNNVSRALQQLRSKFGTVVLIYLFFNNL